MRKISVILFLVFIIFSCGDKKEKDQKNMQSEAKDPINKNQRYFYNRSIEKVIEDISFDADEKKGEKVIVTKELVASKLDDIVDNVDTARYIL